MKFNQKGFALVEGLLIVIAITLIGGVGFYVVNANKEVKKNEPSNSQVNEQKAEASKEETKDPYDGWQTFTDKEFGFTLKYPADWKFNEKQSLNTTDSQGNTIYDNPNFTSKDGHERITFTAGKLKGAYTNAKEAFKEEGAGRAGDVLEEESLTINGYSAYRAKTSHMGGTFSIYSIMNNGMSLDLSSNYSSNEVNKNIANSVKFN